MSEPMPHIEIRGMIPHRYPFLLIDTVESWEEGKTLTGLKNVTANEPFFQGHFPVKPVMPGVLIIESLAQACGCLLVKTLPREMSENYLFYLTGVDNARFKRMVVPGDQLILKVTVEKNRRDLWKFHAEATVKGELACSADILIVKDANVIRGGSES